MSAEIEARPKPILKFVELSTPGNWPNPRNIADGRVTHKTPIKLSASETKRIGLSFSFRNRLANKAVTIGELYRILIDSPKVIILMLKYAAIIEIEPARPRKISIRRASFGPSKLVL